RLGLPPAAVIAPDLAQRLRKAQLGDELAAAVVAALEQGVAARYGGGGGLDAAAVRALVGRLEAAAIPRLPAAPGGLLGALLALGTALPAQTEGAVEAYRRGDYAAADAAFAAQFQRTHDRRLWSARGNCFYRRGDLPRALWAYECARLGLPRDSELL